MSPVLEREGAREVGSSIEARCDEESCSMVIDLGPSYRCAGQCGRYLCPVHLVLDGGVRTCVRCAVGPGEDDEERVPV